VPTSVLESELDLFLLLDPGQVGVETLLKEVAKLRQIRALGLPKDLFSHLSPKVVRVYRQRASAEAPSHLRAYPDQIRYTFAAMAGFIFPHRFYAALRATTSSTPPTERSQS
jgi:hypothetical protein